METRYRNSLIAALIALLSLALAQGFCPEAEDKAALMLIARQGDCAVYAGVDFASERTLTYAPAALLAGDLLYLSPAHPLPEAAPARQARGLRRMIGLYVPTDASVALSQETIYALCDVMRERFLTYVTVSEGARAPQAQTALQNAAFQTYLATLPAAEALRRAAEDVPCAGESEHQLPTAFDVRLEGKLDWSQADPLLRNEDGAWLCENAHRFGLIRRYPPDKRSVTGVKNEETHFRYVGQAHALIMHAAGWCLEEYLSALHENGALTLIQGNGAPVYVLCAPVTEDGAAFACPAGYTGKASADNLGYAICALSPV